MNIESAIGESGIDCVTVPCALKGDQVDHAVIESFSNTGFNNYSQALNIKAVLCGPMSPNVVLCYLLFCPKLPNVA
jgi:hypothetical protein